MRLFVVFLITLIFLGCGVSNPSKLAGLGTSSKGKLKMAKMKARAKKTGDSLYSLPTVIDSDVVTGRLEDKKEISDSVAYKHVIIEQAMVEMAEVHNAGMAMAKKEREMDVMLESPPVDAHTGKIAYTIPDSMIVGETRHVKVRITKEKDATHLIIGDHKIPIVGADEKSKVTVVVESVRVESKMSAELISLDSAFITKSGSTLEQEIEDRGYTEWEWAITPTRAGPHQLKLVVKVYIKKDKVYKDIVVFERIINAKANYTWTITTFAKKNWHYIMSSMIIPFIGWWWKRRKEKKDKENTPAEDVT